MIKLYNLIYEFSYIIIFDKILKITLNNSNKKIKNFTLLTNEPFELWDLREYSSSSGSIGSVSFLIPLDEYLSSS